MKSLRLMQRLRGHVLGWLESFSRARWGGDSRLSVLREDRKHSRGGRLSSGGKLTEVSVDDFLFIFFPNTAYPSTQLRFADAVPLILPP